MKGKDRHPTDWVITCHLVRCDNQWRDSKKYSVRIVVGEETKSLSPQKDIFSWPYTAFVQDLIFIKTEEKSWIELEWRCSCIDDSVTSSCFVVSIQFVLFVLIKNFFLLFFKFLVLHSMFPFSRLTRKEFSRNDVFFSQIKDATFFKVSGSRWKMCVCLFDDGTSLHSFYLSLISKKQIIGWTTTITSTVGDQKQLLSKCEREKNRWREDVHLFWSSSGEEEEVDHRRQERPRVKDSSWLKSLHLWRRWR